jgi:hypothetical protein
VESQCCTALQTCDGSTACLDWLDCALQCADQTCIDSCDATYPTGSSQYIALDSCITNSCSIECPAG